MKELAGIHGTQRVAAFLLSLEPAVATAILKGMNPDAVARVARAMIDLDPRLAQEGVIDGIFRDIARALHGRRAVGSCDTDHLKKLLGEAFGRQGDELFKGIMERRSADRPFLALERHPPLEIARVLAGESSAVSALVLAHLEPSHAAAVLKTFEPEVALDVVRRMVTLEPPSPTVLRTIAADLVQRVASTPPPPAGADPKHRLKSVAELLNNSAPEIEKKVIESLNETDAEVANELREQLFTWEDIGTLNRRAMQKILGTVDTKTLSIALKGCSEAVEKSILGNLSSRVRDMVAEERELAGPLPMADIKAARDEILKSIRALIEAGEFRPSRGGDDLVA
jgi:flagellar motor switch protein FliG